MSTAKRVGLLLGTAGLCTLGAWRFGGPGPAPRSDLPGRDVPPLVDVAPPQADPSAVVAVPSGPAVTPAPRDRRPLPPAEPWWGLPAAWERSSALAGELSSATPDQIDAVASRAEALPALLRWPVMSVLRWRLFHGTIAEKRAALPAYARWMGRAGREPLAHLRHRERDLHLLEDLFLAVRIIGPGLSEAAADHSAVVLLELTRPQRLRRLADAGGSERLLAATLVPKGGCTPDELALLASLTDGDEAEHHLLEFRKTAGWTARTKPLMLALVAGGGRRGVCASLALLSLGHFDEEVGRGLARQISDLPSTAGLEARNRLVALPATVNAPFWTQTIHDVDRRLALFDRSPPRLTAQEAAQVAHRQWRFWVAEPPDDVLPGLEYRMAPWREALLRSFARSESRQVRPIPPEEDPLLAALRSSDPMIQYEGVRYLARRHMVPAETLSALGEVVSGKGFDDARVVASELLLRDGFDGQTSLSRAMRELLKRGSPDDLEMLRICIRLVGESRRAALSCVVVLRPMALEGSPVRFEALVAIHKIDPDYATASAIRKTIPPEEPMFGVLYDTSEPATNRIMPPVWREMMKEDNRVVAVEAAAAMLRAEPGNADAIGVVEAWVADPCDGVDYQRVLRSYLASGPGRPEAIKRLERRILFSPRDNVFRLHVGAALFWLKRRPDAEAKKE